MSAEACISTVKKHEAVAEQRLQVIYDCHWLVQWLAMKQT